MGNHGAVGVFSSSCSSFFGFVYVGGGGGRGWLHSFSGEHTGNWPVWP